MTPFEAAVEAIINGDALRLSRLPNDNPDLVRECSTQEHRSTLLHYVSANGVEHRASFAGNDVVTCLRNGRGQAAEFLANHGAHLDLEGAAGLGKLDLVQSLFNTATEEQLTNGFYWACEFGRTSVVEFLLQKGVGIGHSLRWAAHGGHATQEATAKTKYVLPTM